MGHNLRCNIAQPYSNSCAIGQKSHQSHQNPVAENGSPCEELLPSLAFQVHLNKIVIYVANDFSFSFLCLVSWKWIISCRSDTAHFFSAYLCLHILFSRPKLPLLADVPAAMGAASTQASLTDHHLLKLGPLKVHLNCPFLKKLFLPAHPRLTQSLPPIHPGSICFNSCMSLFMGFGTEELIYGMTRESVNYRLYCTFMYP